MILNIPPNLLLNAYGACSDAKSTVGIPLDLTTPVTLNKNEKKTVEVSVTVPISTVKTLDVLFLVDTTGSFNDDIATYKAKATEILNDLNSRGIDAQLGVASFADFPIVPFGNINAGDKAFYLNQVITGNVDLVKTAINNLDNPLHDGGDIPEAQLEALYQSVTGAGRHFTDNPVLDIMPGNIGWRSSSLKVIIMSTDANFHYPEKEISYPRSSTFTDTINALNAKGISVIGLDSGDTQGDLKKVVDAAGGSLFLLSGNSAGIADKIKSAMDTKLSSVSLSIQKISGDEWVSNVTPVSFAAVTAGKTQKFTVELTGIRSQAIEAQNYAVYLWVRGDNSAIMKRVKIPILVPSVR